MSACLSNLFFLSLRFGLLVEKKGGSAHGTRPSPSHIEVGKACVGAPAESSGNRDLKCVPVFCTTYLSFKCWLTNSNASEECRDLTSSVAKH